MGAAAVNSSSWLAGAAHPFRVRLPGERGGHAIAAEPVGRGRLQGKARGVDGHQAPIPGLCRLLGLARQCSHSRLPATPSFRALASMTVARVPSRMKVPSKLVEARPW